MIYIIWIWILIAALALYFHKIYSRFSKYGVKNMTVVPLFGNMLKIVFKISHFGDEMNRMYKMFKGERFVGRYEFIKPIIVVQDLELVKKITIKDFEHFLDHRTFTDEKNEPLFARNLFSLKGQEWKDMRSTLSPFFTKSKIKAMVPFMEEVGEQMIRVLKIKINESDSGDIDVNVKDLTTRYANDVIASCAFGLKIDSHTDETNQFYEMGKIASTFNFRQMFIFFFNTAFPAISNILKLKFFSDSTNNFFVDLVTETMKNRQSRNIIRPDLIHLLMEAKIGKLSHEETIDTTQDTGFSTVKESSIGKKTVNKEWSDTDLIAQAVLFFMVGFDTVSTVMSFALHELAIHPEVQERLAQEIMEHYIKNGGNFDLDSIQNMTYLDMVTSETLRFWPPTIALDRICVKDYNLGRANSKATEDYIIRKGDLISIPVWSFHHDPELFANPNKFDPDRFSEENKSNINPTAYLPFGIGPRNCIGSRFALCELKVLLYQLLLHIEVFPSEKTCIPAQLSPGTFKPRLSGGHWVKFKPRSLVY